MIDLRYKPFWLPQVHAPHDVVISKLDGEGVNYSEEEINPEELNPTQGIVFSDEVSSIKDEEMSPIWCSNDNKVIDGHHRYLKALMNQTPIKIVRVDLNANDTARVLNKVQDIYEYEKQQGLEEVVSQNAINDRNEIDSEGDEIMDVQDFLKSLEEVESPKGDGCKVIAYREKPIMENSAIGNFFILSPQSGYDKYEIDFENLLDTNDLGIDVTGKNPVDSLAKTWFPNVDFENMSAPYNHTPENLRNKAITEKAKQMGYDGIKYGDMMVQGLK